MTEKKPERRGLGRGLSALMADVAPTEAETRVSPNETADERLVPIEKIKPNPDQPRRDFAEEQLNDLAQSIREKGVIQPLILRPDPKEAGSFQIVAGERRWRASQRAQLHAVPALVRDYDETEVLEIAIIENIQREELNSIEEAAGYRQLMDRFGHTQEKISEALGKSRSHIANLLRLLNLPDTVQKLVRDGSLSAGHARTLVNAENSEELAKTIIQRGLSVRAAEKLAKDAGKEKPVTKPVKPSSKDADTVALENDLSAALGMKVAIDHKDGGGNGKLQVSYSSLEALDKLCNLLSANR